MIKDLSIFHNSCTLLHVEVNTKIRTVKPFWPHHRQQELAQQIVLVIWSNHPNLSLSSDDLDRYMWCNVRCLICRVHTLFQDQKLAFIGPLEIVVSPLTIMIFAYSKIQNCCRHLYFFCALLVSLSSSCTCNVMRNPTFPSQLISFRCAQCIYVVLLASGCNGYSDKSAHMRIFYRGKFVAENFSACR